MIQFTDILGIRNYQLDHIAFGPSVIRAVVSKRGIVGTQFRDCAGECGLLKSRQSKRSVVKKSRKLGKGKCGRLRAPSWDADLE